MTALEHWEGAVEEVGDETFTAEIAHADGDRMTAELALADIEPDDRELCRPGALFLWEIHDGFASLQFRRIEGPTL